jgi:hypothetical protein
VTNSLGSRCIRLALALSLLDAAAVQAQCPNNPTYAPVWPDAQAFTNQVFQNCPQHPPTFPGAAHDCAGSGEYDLHLGTALLGVSYTGFVSNENTFICSPGSYLTMLVSDRFMITGPASAVPLAFDARLRIQGQRTAGPVVGQVSFGTETDSLVFQAPVSPAIDQQVVLHLSHLQGEPFLLMVRPAASGFCQGAVSLRTTLTFALPPGYGVSSCHGYQAAVTTASRRSSWGRIKGIYR